MGEGSVGCQATGHSTHLKSANRTFGTFDISQSDILRFRHQPTQHPMHLRSASWTSRAFGISQWDILRIRHQSTGNKPLWAAAGLSELQPRRNAL